MDIFTEILEKSYSQYQDFYGRLVATVELAHQYRYKEIVSHVDKLNTIFEDIQKIDKKLFSLSSDYLIQSNADLWQRRAYQVDKILAFHKESLPHLQSIMAMQKVDIQNLRSGRRSMNGYRTDTKQTGKFISNSS
jgi:hypothetical protein